MTDVSSDWLKLQALVQKAEDLLETQGDFYTDGAKLALKDMVNQAKLALKGGGEPPFTRNREFHNPRAEEAILFATRRYTMVPPFTEEGTVYSHYGLEPALEWFEKQNVMSEGAAQLPGKAAFVLEKARNVLDQAGTGHEVGEYSEEAKGALSCSMDTLKNELVRFNAEDGGEELGRRIVDVFNRLREFRHSRRLRTDIEPDSSLYLMKEGLQELRSSIESSALIRGQFEHISQLAAIYNLEDLKQAFSWIMEGEAGYDALNRHFYLWSSTDKIVNFKVPEGAATATLSFILPAEENEQDGLGHVWIDDVEILSASGGSLDIGNGGFDEGNGQPRCWERRRLKGAPVLKWEEEYPFCGGGSRSPEAVNPSSQVDGRKKPDGISRSLYICNPTPGDEGAWAYSKEFAVKPGTGCTLTFAAKLDGKLKKGLKALINYRDEAGRPAGMFEYLFNRKSSLPGGRFQLTMQCDAIKYAMTSGREYAEKVKLAILYILHDFCQGAEHWLVTNLRPEGNDSYGAVQGGRLLCAVAVSYSLIRTADVFSTAEKKRFFSLAEYMLRYMLDLRDRTEWTPYEAQRGCSNWQTDMCAGTGMLMMALEDFPNRHTWLNNANTILKAQLELNVNPDGSWPESIRYHHAALERFAGYAKVLENVTGESWFETTPLVGMFGYGVDMQTPGYEYFGGHIGTPPFGDHALGGGGEFGYFAGFLRNISKYDRDLADRMYHTWVLAGRPFKKLWGEGIMLENIAAGVEHYVPAKPLLLASTDAYPHAGIYIFRKKFGSPSQSYFAIMSSPQPVAHGHLDQGAFVLYKNSVPLVMDSGIEGYFDSSTSWHISSYSHACLQFATRQQAIVQNTGGTINLSAGTYSQERGWADVPKTSRVLDVRLREETESIAIEIANPEGPGRHIRHVIYVKEPDVYIIRDHVADFAGKVLFNLPVAARQSRVYDNRVYSQGAYGVDLETVFLGPLESIALDKGRSTPFYERDGSLGEPCMMDYVRAVADARHGFLTVLHPKVKGEAGLTARREADQTVCLTTDHHQIRIAGLLGGEGADVRVEVVPKARYS
ncbi:heparinase II/III domain-containing protein [Paenibacillus sp. HW567]|uniref:heparinase II/III domain-containing protein n=1 Tax=Paenibacillus sp. HW567 TaxID=1034769 RepID=UPI00036C6CA0|nr:heparinase II/III family protein [Paenibacillus sp. HW567]